MLALSEAGNLGIRRRVVLPFDRSQFRETSVTDRPGDWGRLYDSVLSDVEKNCDLVIMRMTPGDQAYAAANHKIIEEALLLGQELQFPVTAVIVWDGKSRGTQDLTEEFRVSAREKNIPVLEVMTLRKSLGESDD